mgnify:CR=1 FL=1
MKLTGIQVVDLSTFLPGPYLSMIMADHGADVIKVEAPGEGDPGRSIGLKDGPHTVFFRNLNRGKKSVQLDLKSDEGRQALLALLSSADVFLESFRPGVMKRLGIDYDTVRVTNPGIVYCSISAFGQDGPYAQHPAHDLAVEALSGALTLGVDEKHHPTIPGIAVADIATAYNGLSGVLMALLRRTQTGKGDRIDISMHESMLAVMPNVMGPAFAENRQPDPKAERSTGGSAFYNIYETSDGRHIVLGGQETKFVRAVLAKLGKLELAELCERGPGLHQQPLIEFLRDTFKTKTQDQWVIWFSGVDACFSPVKTMPESLVDAQIVHRGFVLSDGKGRPYLGAPIRFLDEPAQIDLRTPALGEHQHLVNAVDGTI